MYLPKIQVWYESGRNWLRYLAGRAGNGNIGQNRQADDMTFS